MNSNEVYCENGWFDEDRESQINRANVRYREQKKCPHCADVWKGMALGTMSKIENIKSNSFSR